MRRVCDKIFFLCYDIVLAMGPSLGSLLFCCKKNSRGDASGTVVVFSVNCRELVRELS